MTRIINNVEIAKAVANEFGIQYMSQEYLDLLDGIDIGRSPEQKKIPVVAARGNRHLYKGHR